MKHFYTYLFIYLFIGLKAQINLVPNPSFEDTSQQCFSAMNINLAKHWYSPCNTSPDYFNFCGNAYNYPSQSTIPISCYGYQFPRTGDAFAGIGTYIVNGSDSVHYFAEYISVKLTDTLKAGHCIYAEFYMCLGDICEFGINRLGLYLTPTTFTTSLGSFTNTIQPQVEFDSTQFYTDTLNWVKVSGSFTAQGGETYLTIGNFKDGDHVKKINLSSAFTTPCGLPSDHHFAYVYIDDVLLYDCTDVGIQDLENDHSVSLYPNPANTEVYISAKGYEQLTISIYNTMGQLMIRQPISHKQVIDVKMLSPGTYMYRLYNGPAEVKTGKLMISR